MTVDLRYISLGAGVQSTAVLAMSALGLHGCPKADVALFADTQDEPAWVYDHLQILIPWAFERGIPVKIVSRGKLSDDSLRVPDGHATSRSFIPLWTLGQDGRAAPLRRKCTEEYKIIPIMRAVRALLGFEPRQRVTSQAEAFIGISLDEAHRMKPSQHAWIENRYPLVDAGLRRDDCFAIIQAAGLPRPKKSACVFCPYRSAEGWRDLRKHDPAGFEAACSFDEKTRNMSRAGVERPVFVHRSLQPLREIDFADQQMKLFGDGFGNECDGMCGV